VIRKNIFRGFYITAAAAVKFAASEMAKGKFDPTAKRVICTIELNRSFIEEEETSAFRLGYKPRPDIFSPQHSCWG
jgi:hypothetical protein